MLLSGEVDRPELLAHELTAWRSAIAGRCGLDFGAGRERSLSRGLWGRAREVGVRSYAEYRRFLGANGSEWQQLIERLVNPETRFWRHAPSFDYLVEAALPELRRAKALRFDSGPLRLWSAGCSTGDEAYSLAIAGLAGIARTPGLSPPVRVLGTDLSETALTRARRGRYAERSVSPLPAVLKARFVRPADPADADLRLPFEIAPELRDAVTFLRANLTEEGAPAGLQDVIFCQNVLLYFHSDLRLEVVRRLARQLAPGGFLFLAPGEVVGLRLPELNGLRGTQAAVYRRTESPPPPAAEES